VASRETNAWTINYHRFSPRCGRKGTVPVVDGGIVVVGSSVDGGTVEVGSSGLVFGGVSNRITNTQISLALAKTTRVAQGKDRTSAQ